MNLFNMLVILFLIATVVILYLALSKSKPEDKKINPDIPVVCTGPNCKVDCGILNPLTVTKCENTPEGLKVCNKCKCDSSGKLSGCTECRESDPFGDDPKKIITLDPKIYPKEKCNDPYVWDEKQQICKLGQGFFCLPTYIDPIICNKYTGRQVLTLNDSDGVYRYGYSCICKDDTMFSGESCTNINVCGLEGSQNNPDNNDTGRGLLKKGTKNDYWNNDSNWNPMIPNSGTCQCRNYEFSDDNKLLCLPDGCAPAGFIDQTDPDRKTCNCKGLNGYIDCREISETHDEITYYNNGVCKIPSCVPDPCGGRDGTHGKYVYDPKNDKGTCQCNTNDGYSLVLDPTSFTGVSCKKLCDPGPCANRGTCKVTSIDKAYTFFNIICSETDDIGGCQSHKFFVKYKRDDNNVYYLTYDQTSEKLIFTTDINSLSSLYSEYSLEMKVCDNGAGTPPPNSVCSNYKSVPVQNGLISGNFYYLKIGSNYLSLIEDNNGNYKLVDSSKKEESLFRLINESNSKITSSSVKGAMFLSNNKYLSVRDDGVNDPTISYKPNITTPEYCDSCTNGWAQDDQMLCNTPCFKPGEWFDNRYKNPDQTDYNVCCSGKIQNQTSKSECVQYSKYGNCLMHSDRYSFQCA